MSCLHAAFFVLSTVQNLKIFKCLAVNTINSFFVNKLTDSLSFSCSLISWHFHPVIVENHKILDKFQFWPYGVAIRNVRGVRFTLWGPWVFVQSYMHVHGNPFSSCWDIHPGPKWCTNWEISVVIIVAASMAKNTFKHAIFADFFSCAKHTLNHQGYFWSVTISSMV